MDKFSLTQLLPPASEPITLDEARSQMRAADEECEDAVINGYIAAARQYFEEHDDRRLIAQTYLLKLDCFSNAIEIPLRPVQLIDAIRYIDGDGVQQTLDPSLYLIDYSSFLTRIYPSYGNYWPTIRYQAAAVEVEFIVGYSGLENYDEYSEWFGPQTGIPANIKQALLLLITEFYEERKNSGVIDLKNVPMGYDMLVASNRRIWA